MWTMGRRTTFPPVLSDGSGYPGGASTRPAIVALAMLHAYHIAAELSRSLYPPVALISVVAYDRIRD